MSPAAHLNDGKWNIIRRCKPACINIVYFLAYIANKFNKILFILLNLFINFSFLLLWVLIRSRGYKTEDFILPLKPSMLNRDIGLAQSWQGMNIYSAIRYSHNRHPVVIIRDVYIMYSYYQIIPECTNIFRPVVLNLRTACCNLLNSKCLICIITAPSHGQT